jgi:hypothetical protein
MIAVAPAGPGGAAGGFATRRQAALDAVWAGWRATTNRPGGPNRFYRAMALRNPWMSRMPGGPLVVRDGACSVRYDFEEWERKEQGPQ